MIPDLRVRRVPASALVRLASVLVIVAAAMFMVTCDKVPLTAPSNATIRLVANTNVVPLGGTAQVTATVIANNGYAVHNGTQVSFTTSLGTVEPSEAETQDGKVTVTFRAGTQSGTAVVNAYSGSASTSTTTTGTTTGTTGTTATGSGGGVTFLVGAAAASLVTATATPGTVPAAGGTATITASVFDANRNLLPGVPVTFSTDVGTITPSVGTTDANGQAQAQLQTFATATVTVTLAAGGGTGGGTTGGTSTATVKVTVIPQPTVTIGAPSTSPTAGIPTSFTVTVAPATGGAPITNATIDFGDGTTMNLGQPNGATTVSHTYSEADTFTVTVTATDASGQKAKASVPVTVLAAQPFTVTMSASSGRVNTPVTITATPAAGAPAINRYVWNVGGSIVGHPDGIIETSIPTVTVIYNANPCGTGASVCTVQINVTAYGVDGRIGFGSTSTTITP